MPGGARANQFVKGDYREMIQRLIRFFTMGVEVLLVPRNADPPTDMESITACAQVAKDASEAIETAASAPSSRSSSGQMGHRAV